MLTNYVPEPNFMQSRPDNQKRSKCSVRSEWAPLFCTDLLCHQHLKPHGLRRKVFHSVLGGMAMQSLWKRVIRLLCLTISQEPLEWGEAGAHLFFNRAFFFEPVTQHFIFKGSRVAHCALLNFGDRCGIFYNLNHSCGKMHRSDVNCSYSCIERGCGGLNWGFCIGMGRLYFWGRYTKWKCWPTFSIH